MTPVSSPRPLARRRARLASSDATRSLGGGALLASLAIHALAVGGVVWATWFRTTPGDGQPAMSFEFAAAQETDAAQEPSPEPLPPLDWREPTAAEVVELPFEFTPADETRFDPQLTEVREPTRAIARWMDTPWTKLAGGASTSAPASGGAGELQVAALAPSPQPAQPDPLAQTPPPEQPTSRLQFAQLIHRPDPQYPRASLRLREHGTTLLRLHVDEGGAVRDVEVVRSSGSQRLDRAAAEGVKSWRFEPARRDGAAIPTSVLHQITFTLGAS